MNDFSEYFDDWKYPSVKLSPPVQNLDVLMNVNPKYSKKNLEVAQKLDSDLEVYDYQQLWEQKYQSQIDSTKLSPSDKARIGNRIRKLLCEAERITDVNTKITAVAELFDYIASDGYIIFGRTFFECVVIEKIRDLHSDASCKLFFELIKPDTKEFIYALSGIKC